MTIARKYTSPAAFRQALEQRLKQWVQDDAGGNLMRYRRQIAFDRLLARLFSTAPTPWVLKGGYAMELRIFAARSTVDLDLSFVNPKLLPREGFQQAIRKMLQAAAQIDLGDFFAFEIRDAVLDLAGPPYGGARYPVEALMDRRTFAKFSVDVGVGDAYVDPPDLVESRDWLAFARIPMPPLATVSKEQHFAEKLHAYTMPRPTANSRVKDLVDMVLLIKTNELNQERLQRAIRATFERRASHPVPVNVEPPPDEWKKPYSVLAAECGLSESLLEAIAVVRTLDKVWT